MQGRQWGGADLVVHSWAQSGPQEELLVWPGLTQGQALPAPGEAQAAVPDASSV